MFYSDSIRVQPELTENAIRVLKKRYLRGETPEQMFWRVASTIAQAEIPYLRNAFIDGRWEDALHKITTQFYNLMATLDFLPNSPTLMNAGRPLGQLSGCFVLPIEDSMEGIADAIKYMMMVQKSGGGTGFDFSSLRPKGDPVTSTVGEASGPVSFMHAFNACTEVVKQGGSRRGANMGILRIDHPDILSFIEVKKDLSLLTNFNMSVAITDEFMECLAENKPFTLRYKDEVYAKVDPHELLDRIAYRAWSTGEPGVIFIDKVNADNPTPHIGQIASTNPCGEQPLLPFESCNLGSINLANMVRADAYDDDLPANKVNWGRLKDAVWLATQFLDDVIDVNHYPLPQIDEMTKGNRKIGLGIMGWADMLFQLKIPYNSVHARNLAEDIMEFIQHQSHMASCELGKWKGPFPNYEGSKWYGHQPMRNAATITIAPTGTLSVIASVSSGIEPLFGLFTIKQLAEGVSADDGRLEIFNPHLVRHLEQYYDEETRTRIMNYIVEKGTLQGIPFSVLEITREIFKVASDIDPRDHILMQAAFQKYVDNAVSKTINFDNGVSPEEIRDAILLAYTSGCKGVTVYRDGSRSSQPLTKGVGNSKEPENNKNGRNGNTEPVSENRQSNNVVDNSVLPAPRHRPRITTVPGITTGARTGCGSLFVTINDHNEEIYEVFVRTGNNGGCSAYTDSTGRLISIALRYGVPPEEIISQLNSVVCANFRHQAGKDKTLVGKSCPDVIGRAMVERMKELGIRKSVIDRELKVIPIASDAPVVVDDSEAKCPECGKPIYRAEGCLTCPHCGYSHC